MGIREAICGEVDMLQGNINRLCVTSDQEELISSYFWAMRRINNLYEIRRASIRSYPVANGGDESGSK